MNDPQQIQKRERERERDKKNNKPHYKEKIQYKSKREKERERERKGEITINHVINKRSSTNLMRERGGRGREGGEGEREKNILHYKQKIQYKSKRQRDGGESERERDNNKPCYN